MWGSRKNRIPISCCHETLPRRTGRGPEWNVRKFWLYRPPFLRDGRLKIFNLNLSISKMGRAIFAKFSQIACLSRPSLRFRAEVGGCSNFEASGGQSWQKWHVGLRVGRFGRVPVKLCDR